MSRRSTTARTTSAAHSLPARLRGSRCGRAAWLSARTGGVWGCAVGVGLWLVGSVTGTTAFPWILCGIRGVVSASGTVSTVAVGRPWRGIRGWAGPMAVSAEVEVVVGAGGRAADRQGPTRVARSDPAGPGGPASRSQSLSRGCPSITTRIVLGLRPPAVDCLATGGPGNTLSLLRHSGDNSFRTARSSTHGRVAMNAPGRDLAAPSPLFARHRIPVTCPYPHDHRTRFPARVAEVATAVNNADDIVDVLLHQH